MREIVSNNRRKRANGGVRGRRSDGLARKGNIDRAVKKRAQRVLAATPF
jgi:hypothetical protein